MVNKIYFIALCYVLSAPFSQIDALSATRAYLSIAELKELVQISWKSELKQYAHIIEQVLAREDEYERTHQVFYHAQSQSLRIFQDFLKELYQCMYPNVSVISFHFLRPWYEFPQTIDANTFIDEYEKEPHRGWNDNGSFLSTRMLSVNFSLFGSSCNYGHFGENTFKYFFSNRSIKLPTIEHLFVGVFEHFGFDKKYIAQLIDLSKLIATKEGSLFQIFVPNEFVDQIAFAAQRLGTPYRTPLLTDYFDYEKQRHVRLVPLLDAYCKDPMSIVDVLDRLQGRLLFSQDILLNPKSGVQIFRYTTVSVEQLMRYQKKLQKITQKLFKNQEKQLSVLRGIL